MFKTTLFKIQEKMNKNKCTKTVSKCVSLFFYTHLNTFAPFALP